MSSYAMEDDDIPFSVTEEIDMSDEGDGLGEQQGGVMEPVRKVPFVIRKAKVRVNDSMSEISDDKVWSTKKLSLEVGIGPLGTDGEGKYKGKVFFADLLLVYNKVDFPKRADSDWWKNKARYDTKEFFAALALDPKSKITDEWLQALVGREFIADITKKEIERKVDGKYTKTGEHENILANFKKSLVDAD